MVEPFRFEFNQFFVLQSAAQTQYTHTHMHAHLSCCSCCLKSLHVEREAQKLTSIIIDTETFLTVELPLTGACYIALCCVVAGQASSMHSATHLCLFVFASLLKHLLHVWHHTAGCWASSSCYCCWSHGSWSPKCPVF